MPGFERAFFLYVGEVVVPFEFGDAGNPFGPQREEREDAERGDDERAYTCGVLRRCVLRWIRGGLRRPDEADNFRGAGGGHDPRKVFGIGEEGEDALDRE